MSDPAVPQETTKRKIARIYIKYQGGWYDLTIGDDFNMGAFVNSIRGHSAFYAPDLSVYIPEREIMAVCVLTLEGPPTPEGKLVPFKAIDGGKPAA